MSATYAYGGGPTGMAGKYHYGGGGRGVLGSLVAHVGTNGDGYGYKSLSLPADANKEYYFPLGTRPAGLTFDASEDTGATASGADGTYVYPFSAVENGINIGSSSFSVTFGAGGAPGATLTGTSTFSGGAASNGSAAAPGATLTGAGTMQGGAASGTGAGTAPGATLTGASTMQGGGATNGAVFVSGNIEVWRLPAR